VSIPPIRDVEERIAQAQELLDYLLKEYRWAAHSAWARPNRGGEHVKNSGHSDTTATAASIGSLRAGCRLAVARLDEAVDKLSSALGVLEDRMGHLDPPRTVEPVGPRIAGPSDLAEAAGAKARRESRGEGWGNG
jgi:hypothetical protein